MPAIKNIAALKKKGQHDYSSPEYKPKKTTNSMPWRKTKSGRGGKTKNGRVKKVTKLTAAFVSAASGKRVTISPQAKY